MEYYMPDYPKKEYDVGTPEQKLTAFFEIEDAWIWEINEEYKDFHPLEVLKDHFAKRRAIKNDTEAKNKAIDGLNIGRKARGELELPYEYDITEKVLKLILNSVYGKLAQFVGSSNKVPNCANPYYAAAITASCRRRAIEAAMVDPSAIIFIATDGLLSKRPLHHLSEEIEGVENCPIELSLARVKDESAGDAIGLGDWEYSRREGGIFVMAGVYVHYMIERDLKGEFIFDAQGRPLGPGEQWQTTEGGFLDSSNNPLPAADVFCVEVTSQGYAQFAITYDPSLPALADKDLSTNSPGFAPNPNIFWAISFVPTPANPPYIENWIMTYAEQSGFLGEQQWLPWQSLSAPPGESISGPAACSWGQSRVDVFAVGSDSGLWHLWTDDDGDYQSWQSQEWESLSGNLTLDPAAVSLGVGLISVFGRGPDMALWCIFYFQNAFYLGGQSLGWSDWASLSAPGVGAWNGVPVSSEGDWPLLSPSPGLGIVSKPTAISWGPQLLVVYVFAVTAESGTPALWFLNFNGGWATNWEALALQPPDIAAGTGPCAASWANGRTDLIVMGQTGLWHTWFDYSQGGWAQSWENLLTLPGVTPPLVGFQNSVAMSSSAAGQLDVFLRSIPYARPLRGGNDGDCALWHLTFDQGEWQGWETLGGQITSDPAAVSVALPDGNGIEVFTCGNDGNLWHLQFAFGQSDPVPPSPFM
jgi:hypothetical protein